MMDVIDLRDFYTTPLGDVVENEIKTLIQNAWPTAPSISQFLTLHFGYSLPYLNNEEPAHNQTLIFMPSQMGVIGHPKDSPRSVLVDEDLLPLPDRCVDRLLIIHGLENCHNSLAFLEECHRVLTPEGRLLIIVPNRRGLWCRSDKTPFGSGQPYTMTQLSKHLRSRGFAPQAFLRGLYTPPINSNILISFQHVFEKFGPLILQKFSGLIAIEVTKSVYGAIPATSYHKRFKLSLAALQTRARKST
jgi:SAM-dependent methyltransferase